MRPALSAVPSQLPDPPYPEDIRARGWRFEIEPERLVNSDTWDLASDDMRPWLLMLWFTAWRQSPCGTLPANDAVIAAKLRMPERTFMAHRDILMRGWYMASDGRLYHPVITELVERMCSMRKADRERQSKSRGKKNQQLSPVVTRDTGVSHAESPVSHGTGTGTGTGDVSEEANASSSSPSGDVAAKLPPCPYRAIVDAYHEILPELPGVQLREGTKAWPKRQAAMRDLWVFALTTSKSDGTRRATNAEEALAWIRGYFERARENDFLMGRIERSGKHAGWRADLDYLLTERGMKHVIEKAVSHG